MPKTPKKPARLRRPAKAQSEKLSVKVALNFSREQAKILDRAAAQKFDNRANWCRRTALEQAYKQLGLPLPADHEN